MGPRAHADGAPLQRLWKRKNPGDDLFSRKAALSVSSALESLTSVFGMGTGMASPLASPASCCWIVIGCVRALERFECGRREVSIYDFVVLLLGSNSSSPISP